MSRAARLCALSLVAAGPFGCADDADPGPAAAVSNGTLREEFRGQHLDRRVWNTCHWWADRGCTIASNEELEWYLPGQVRLRDGRLRLVAERRPARGADGRVFPYRSGMISSGP